MDRQLRPSGLRALSVVLPAAARTITMQMREFEAQRFAASVAV